MPAGATQVSRTLRFLFVAMLSLGAVGSLPAHAQQTEVGEIAAAAKRPDDKSRQALVSIFGQVVNDPLASGGAGGGDTILAVIFQRTNSVVSLLGGILLGWGVFRRVARTANSGNAFDQVGSSLWAPVRMVWGMSSLLPTANGWCLAQLTMLWMASVMGIGSANLTVEAAASALVDGTPMVMSPVMPKSASVARQLYEADLCMHGINFGLAQAAAAGGLVDDDEYIAQRPDPAHPDGFMLSDGRGTYTCGAAAVDSQKIEPQPTNTNSLDWGTYDPGVVYAAHIEALQRMQSILDPAAKEFVEATLAVRNGSRMAVPTAEVAIQSAAAAYENIVQARASQSVGSMKELTSQITQNLSRQGWWMLGSWYQTFAMANTKLSDAVSALATVRGPSPFGSSGPADVWLSAVSAYRSQQANGAIATTLGQPPSGPQAAGGSDSGSSLFKAVFAEPGQSLLKVMTDAGSDRNQQNPLIRMKNIGDYCMGMAEGSLTAVVGLSVVLELKDGWSLAGIAAKIGNLATGIGDGFSGAFKAVYPYLFIMILSLFFFGVTLSVYLPMVPFVIWFSAAINWLVVVAEGVVGATLWAFAHLLLADGEGMGQRTMHGYMFLLNVCFRPFLMVIGFFIGGGVLTVGGTFLMDGFSLAVKNAQFDSTTGIFSILAYFWLFIQISLSLAHNSFNLISLLPDQVIPWIGGYAAGKLGMDEHGTRHGFNHGRDKAQAAHQQGGDRAGGPSGAPDFSSYNNWTPSSDNGMSGDTLRLPGPRD